MNEPPCVSTDLSNQCKNQRHTVLYGCVRVQRDLLFIYDKDAVVLRGDAWHRVLTGHLSLIVTAEKDRVRDRQRKDKKGERERVFIHWHTTTTVETCEMDSWRAEDGETQFIKIKYKTWLSAKKVAALHHKPFKNKQTGKSAPCRDSSAAPRDHTINTLITNLEQWVMLNFSIMFCLILDRKKSCCRWQRSSPFQNKIIIQCTRDRKINNLLPKHCNPVQSAVPSTADWIMWETTEQQWTDEQWTVNLSLSPLSLSLYNLLLFLLFFVFLPSSCSLLPSFNFFQSFILAVFLFFFYFKHSLN